MFLCLLHTWLHLLYNRLKVKCVVLMIQTGKNWHFVVVFLLNLWKLNLLMCFYQFLPLYCSVLSKKSTLPPTPVNLHQWVF